MSYVVRQRTREIGTRMALGATGRDVAWLVLRAGSLIATVGTLVGVVVGLLASRVLDSVLYATPRADPVLMLASRRAARLDPARTLTEP